jgi:hypothetical protein
MQLLDAFTPQLTITVTTTTHAPLILALQPDALTPQKLVTTELHVTITMHVPLILAMLKLDVSLPRRIAQDLMHVTPEDVML